LCSLYFVVNGLQMWVTDYLRTVIGAKLEVIVPAFGITAVTGPIVGVVVGGVSLDKIGGYRGHIDRAALLAVGMGFCAGAMAFTSLCVSSFPLFMILIWLLLFFGGAVVPCLTGIVVASVDPDLRSLANSMSGTVYNLLGYFLGPFACGLVAQSAGLEWGFRVVMGTSSLAVLFALISWILARKRVQAALASAKVETVDEGKPSLPTAGEEMAAMPTTSFKMTRRLSFIPNSNMVDPIMVQLPAIVVSKEPGREATSPSVVPNSSIGGYQGTSLQPDEVDVVLQMSFAVQKDDISSAMFRRRAPTIAGRSPRRRDDGSSRRHDDPSASGRRYTVWQAGSSAAHSRPTAPPVHPEAVPVGSLNDSLNATSPAP